MSVTVPDYSLSKGLLRFDSNVPDRFLIFVCVYERFLSFIFIIRIPVERLEIGHKRSKMLAWNVQKRSVMVNGQGRYEWFGTFILYKITARNVYEITVHEKRTAYIALFDNRIYSHYQLFYFNWRFTNWTSLISGHLIIERLPLPSGNITFSSFTTFFTFGTNCFKRFYDFKR